MDYSKVDKLINEGCVVQRDEPLCRHTTFKVGGNADRFVTVYTENQLKCVLKAAAQIPQFILGNGSNILVSDEGFRGVIIRLSGEFTEIKRHEDKITAGAAVTLSSLCHFAQQEGLSGLEFAYGIPGTVGGALYMNAGAYGGEMKDVALSAKSMDFTGKTYEYHSEELCLEYRRSCFQDTRQIITGLTLQLSAGDKKEINDTMQELLSKRMEKQPYSMPSGGSTFKRPKGRYAAELIESCGLKGYTVGGAQVSEKHAGFIINKGTATCKNILDLIEYIQKKVYEKENIKLECEIHIIGEGIQLK